MSRGFASGEIAGTTDCGFRKKRARPFIDGKFGNVAIKREQRLLADYAEWEQRKDCEAGLIIGIIGVIGD